MAKKMLVILFFLFAHASMLMGQDNLRAASSPGQPVADSLSLRKLQLEVQNLETEGRYSRITKPLTILGSLLGLVAILWTIFQGIKTINFQTEQQKQNRISDLLALLNDDKVEKRASAANGLTRYPKEVYQEILASLKSEQVEFIREILEDILLKLPEKEFMEVIKANRETLVNRTRLLGSLGVTGEKIELTEALLGIQADTRIKITANFKYFFDHGQETARYQLYRASQLGKLYPDVRDGLILEALQAARVAYSTSKIISKKLAGNLQLQDLSKLDLNLANLYSLNLAHADFSRSIVTHSICRHTNFDHADFAEANFDFADMFDCKLNYANMPGASFNHASLRRTAAKGVGILNAEFKNSVLSQSDFSQSKFEGANFAKAKIKGVQFNDSRFSKIVFNASELEGSDFTGSVIRETTFYGCVLKGTNFSNCEMENVKFGGADLQGAIFNNSMLKEVDFSGANLKNIRTDHWQLQDCNFDQAKNYAPLNASPPAPGAPRQA